MPLHSPRMDSIWFKNRMKSQGVTQEALAKELGRDRDKIRRILNGTQTMRLDEALTFARVLDTNFVEIAERALDMPEGSLGNPVDDMTVPLRYRVAAAESDSGPFDFGGQYQRVAPPPRWHGTKNAFAAEIADGSVDRRYSPGTTLFCVPPSELGRQLRQGDLCVMLHRVRGKPFEVRAGYVTGVPGRSGFVLIGAASDPKYALSVWFDRGAEAQVLGEMPRNRGFSAEQSEFAYEPKATDAAEIVGIVTGAFQPEE